MRHRYSVKQVLEECNKYFLIKRQCSLQSSLGLYYSAISLGDTERLKKKPKISFLILVGINVDVKTFLIIMWYSKCSSYITEKFHSWRSYQYAESVSELQSL
jgi:hypothetical protein